MKVILLQDVENLGKKYEIKSAKDGYAKNFLMPNNLAKPATKEALKWLATQKEIGEKKTEDDLKKNQEAAEKTDGLEVLISAKIGDQGQLFEKINAQKISEKLVEMGFAIDKNQIVLPEPIGEMGEHPAKIKFEHNLEADIRIIISETK
jgi:large subunit ribosomal protein L9